MHSGVRQYIWTFPLLACVFIAIAIFGYGCSDDNNGVAEGCFGTVLSAVAAFVAAMLASSFSIDA